MVEHFVKRNKLFKDIYYINKGKELCNSGHSYGPAQREYYLLHYIKKGKGVFTVNNVNYHLNEGQYFLILPNEIIEYKASDNIPWEYYWVGFNGEVVSEVLSHIGNGERVGSIRNSEEVFSLFNSLFENEKDNLQTELVFQGYLYILLSNMIENENIVKVENKDNNNRKSYITFAINYIHDNYHRHDFEISEVGEKLALNKSYLSQVFKKVAGITMNEYLINYRIDKSKELLKTTKETIYTIGSMVGYANYLSFVRSFKKVTGMTPTNYKEGVDLHSLL